MTLPFINNIEDTRMKAKDVVFEKAYTDAEIADGNTIPSYGVSWDYANTRVGNSTTDKQKAIALYLRKLKEGRNPKAVERRIAGYI